MRLTPLMREALELSKRQELRRVHRTDQPVWPAHPLSLAALVRRGLLVHSVVRHRDGWKVDRWAITEAGRLALNPPARPAKDTPNLLRVKGAARGLVMVGGVWTEVRQPEPEAVDPASLRYEWSERARARHDSVRDKANGVPGRKAA